MYYAESGDEWKKFNTRDGMGIKLLQRAGIITAIVTQERTKLVARRAEKLTIPELHQGVMDKLTVIREMAARHGFSLKQVAYIGDDVNDLERIESRGVFGLSGGRDAADCGGGRLCLSEEGRGGGGSGNH